MLAHRMERTRREMSGNHLQEVRELFCESTKPSNTSRCSRVGTQCVDVAATLTLAPTAVVGTMSVCCQGTPRITCVTNDNGTSCTVTMTQQLCVSVPIRYGVTMTAGEPTIGCAENCVGAGCC